MATIADLIAQSKELGVFEFYLPFIIMFAILYALFNRSKILGEPDKARNINLIVALASSLFIMIFTPAGSTLITLSTFLSNFFAGSLMVILTLIVFIMVVFTIGSSLGVRRQGEQFNLGDVAKYAVAGGIILAVGVFISSGGLAIFPGLSFGQLSGIPTFILPQISTQDLSIIVIAVLTVAVIAWLAKSEKTPSGGTGTTAGAQQGRQQT